MAIYHLSVKAIGRATGRSSTGAAAYRSGSCIVDERTGLIHDYTRKDGVLHSEMILPEGGTADRSEFWNRLENHHKRGDAVLVREVEVSLPSELSKEARQLLAQSFARELADRYGVAADLALHAPRTITDKDLERDPNQHYEIDQETGRRHNGNWHAHIMLSACYTSPTGELGKKAVELDPIHCQRAKIENMADRERARWADLANQSLEKSGHESRVDHRSLEQQGITDREPTSHLGVAASGIERRTGEASDKRTRIEVAAKASKENRRQLAAIELAKSDLKERIAANEAAFESRKQELESLKLAAVKEQIAPHVIAPVKPAKPVMPRPARSKTKPPIEHKPKLELPSLLQKLLNRFKVEGMENATAKAAEAGKRYTGPVTEITATELAQDLGRQSYAVHQLADLDRRPAIGETVAIQYDDNRKAKVTSRDQGKSNAKTR